MTPTETRLRLLANGYLPIPLNGKRPPMDAWSRIVPDAELIRVWSSHKGYPRATNTGVLAKLTPCLDLDVLDPECVEAMEMHVREFYEDRGHVIARIGKWPKRAIPFRTEEPFKKITLMLGKGDEKIEFLADGQQFVSFGEHPDTHTEYQWPRGSLIEIKHEDLPYIRKDEAEKLIRDLAEIARRYGYNPKIKSQETTTDHYEPTDIDELTRCILSGTSLHNSVVSIAGSYAARGSPQQDCIDYIGLAFTAAHQPRYGGRWDECLAAIKWCYGKEQEKQKTQIPQIPLSPRKHLATLMTQTFEPLKWIVPRYIPEGVTLLAGKPKLGKSWLALAIGLACVREDKVLGERCPKRTILHCALEDTERRLQDRTKTLIGDDREDLENYFYEMEIPKLSKGCIEFLKQRIAEDHISLITIDTLAAISSPKSRDETQTAADYRNLAELTKLAHDTGVSVIVIHHLRKQTAADIFDMISGTTGITAAVDHLMVLDNEGDGLRLATRGRDAEPEDKLVDFDSEMGEWTVTGDYEKEDKGTGKTRQIIRAALDGTAGMAPAEVAKITGLKLNTVQQTLRRMTKDGQAKRTAYGTYHVSG